MFGTILYGHCKAVVVASWEAEIAGETANVESTAFDSNFTEANPLVACWNKGAFSAEAGEICAPTPAVNESADLGDPNEEVCGIVSDLMSWV